MNWILTGQDNGLLPAMPQAITMNSDDFFKHRAKPINNQ